MELRQGGCLGNHDMWLEPHAGTLSFVDRRDASTNEELPYDDSKTMQQLKGLGSDAPKATHADGLT